MRKTRYVYKLKALWEQRVKFYNNLLKSPSAPRELPKKKVKPTTATTKKIVLAKFNQILSVINCRVSCKKVYPKQNVHIWKIMT